MLYLMLHKVIKSEHHIIGLLRVQIKDSFIDFFFFSQPGHYLLVYEIY